MSEERYQFVKKNIHSDASEDLKKMTSRVYLILGEKDIHVDPVETKKAYKDTVTSNLLTVEVIENAEHTMVNPNIAHSEILTSLVAIFAPKYFLINDDFLDYSESILN